MSTVSSEFVAALRDATIVAPELPEAAAHEVYERLCEQEAALLAPGKNWHEVRLADYDNGSAEKPDDTWVQDVPEARVVASADHATNPYNRRTGVYRRADHGTGALVMLLAQDGHASGVAPRGMQTWNVAVSDDADPVKQAIRQMLPSRDGFLSVHGMFSGKLRHVSDPSEIHAVIGLGAEPNELSWEAAKKVVQAGKDLGLRLSIANQESLGVYDPASGVYSIDPATGEPVRSRLQGSKPAMTNALAYTIMEETGLPKASMQIELAAMLRLRPMDDEGGWHRNEKARAVGTYLGYMLTKAAAEAVAGAR